jgi:hypothetical protein
MKQDMIVILDLGSEENPRLAREIRALGVYSEIYPHDITLAELNALPNVKGIILNGGPNHVVDGVEIDACSDIYGCGLPLLQATKAARRGPRMRRSGKPSCPNLYSMPAVRSPTGTWRTSLQTRSS